MMQLALQLAFLRLAAGMRHASEADADHLQEVADSIRADGNLRDADTELQTPLRDHSLVDVADMIRELDARGTLRCCCDAPKHSALHWHSMSDHSGRCSVDFRPGGHCRDYGRDGRPWQIGRMHHYTSTGAWCRIDPAEVDTVMRSIGRVTPSFCEEVQDNATGIQLVPASHLDEVVSVTCLPGWRTAMPRVTCTFNTPNATHMLEPAPHCDKISDYCGAAQVGPMSVVSSSVGDTVDVNCNYRTLETTRATCGDDAAYHPEPACPEPPEDATARAVIFESTGRGKCCCDLSAAGLWGWLDPSEARTGHCSIYEGITQCKSLPGVQRLVHYTRTEEQRCTIFH